MEAYHSKTSDLLLVFWILVWSFSGIFVNGALMEVKEPSEKCQEADLDPCSATAESLIKDPGLIFPDKPATLNRVCSMWDNLTACINKYTKKCYTRSEKIKFDRLFRESIAAMTVVCTDQSYRNDYLKYAPCVKRVTTAGEYCGFPYQILIDQISRSHVKLNQLCCARKKFKACILEKTKEVCDNVNETKTTSELIPFGSVKPMNITTFAQQVVDKSLAFIAQQCAELKIRDYKCSIGNAVHQRPNSKASTALDEVQRDAPPTKPVHQSSELVTVAPTKFQTGQKGTFWSSNTIPIDEKKQQQQSTTEFKLPGNGDIKYGNRESMIVSTSIPKDTKAAKEIDVPQNDKLKLHERHKEKDKSLTGEEGENGGATAFHMSVMRIFLIVFSVILTFRL